MSMSGNNDFNKYYKLPLELHGGWKPSPSDSKRTDVEMNSMRLLYVIKRDALAGIYGEKAVSRIHLMRILTWIFQWFIVVAEKLKEQDSPMYYHAYEADGIW
ncbi:hypothetical protein F4804DRAFT_333399 [Jackrogersella minutella]|nr:hypothetical protein F4804DRAFT_333399 [Jackrogersella minutella]